VLPRRRDRVAPFTTAEISPACGKYTLRWHTIAILSAVAIDHPLALAVLSQDVGDSRLIGVAPIPVWMRSVL